MNKYFINNTAISLWRKVTSLFVRREIIEIDPSYFDAVEFIKGKSYITYNQLQRGLNIGYARTSHILDLLEGNNKIDKKKDNKEKRKVLI